MSGFRHFYPAVIAVGLLPWIIGGLLLGKTGLVAGLLASFLGIMLLTDANRRRAAEQRRRLRSRARRGGPG